MLLSRTWLSPIVLFVLLLALSGCRSSNLPELYTLPAFELTAQDGAVFRSREKLAGKVWVADFMFTSCMGPCPRMTSQMRRLQKDLSGQPDIRFVSITVDPETDTPKALTEFAARYHAEPGWFFLTGPAKKLDELCFNGFHLGRVDGSYQHSTRFVLVDRKSRIRGFYESDRPEQLEKLRRDARALLKENS